MKKVFVMLAMLAMTLAANAQFEQGKTFVGASLTGLDMNYNGANKFSIGLDAQVGAFVKDNWLVYGMLGYMHKGGDAKVNDFKIGAGARYYILQNGLFVGANAKYSHYKYGDMKFNDFKPSVELGYAFFVSQEMTIEPSIYYEQSFKDHSNFSTIGFKIGVGLYHAKDKIKNSVKEAFE